MKQWYETLFENFADGYDKEPFTQGALGECDFIEQEIGADKGTRILDIGIFGAKLGAFSRNDKLGTEDFEMLVVSTKL